MGQDRHILVGLLLTVSCQLFFGHTHTHLGQGQETVSRSHSWRGCPKNHRTPANCLLPTYYWMCTHTVGRRQEATTTLDICQLNHGLRSPAKRFKDAQVSLGHETANPTQASIGCHAKDWSKVSGVCAAMTHRDTQATEGRRTLTLYHTAQGCATVQRIEG